MLAARITLPHFSVSPAICFPKIRRASCGEWSPRRRGSVAARGARTAAGANAADWNSGVVARKIEGRAIGQARAIARAGELAKGV